MTEEGKRTCPLADRPILEAHRLPSSVTAPQSLLWIKGSHILPSIADIDNILLRCRATFSSGEGFSLSCLQYIDNLPAFSKVGFQVAENEKPQPTSESLLPRRRWHTATYAGYLQIICQSYAKALTRASTGGSVTEEGKRTFPLCRCQFFCKPSTLLLSFTILSISSQTSRNRQRTSVFIYRITFTPSASIRSVRSLSFCISSAS